MLPTIQSSLVSLLLAYLLPKSLITILVSLHHKKNGSKTSMMLTMLFKPLPLLLFIRNLFHGLMNFLLYGFLIDISVCF